MAQEKVEQAISQAYELLTRDISASQCSGLLGEATLNIQSFKVARLVFLVASSVDSSSLTSLIPFANSCHLMYSAMRVIDDAADADRSDSIAATYGNASAIFGGLTLWFSAQQKLMDFAQQHQPGNSPEELLQVVTAVNQMILSTVKGHLLDHCENPKYTEEYYFQKVSLKSALFLEMVFKLASYFAGAEPATVTKYSLVGYKLGVLCQVKNDLDSCYEREVCRNSLGQRLLSLPVVYALSEATGLAAEEFKAYWHSSLQLNEFSSVTTWLEKCGAIEYTRLIMHWLRQQIITLLDLSCFGDQEVLKFVEKQLM